MAVRNATEAVEWLQTQGIRRVEVVFADLTSVARGKTMDVASFVQTLGARLPTLLLGLTVTGGEPPACWFQFVWSSYGRILMV